MKKNNKKVSLHDLSVQSFVTNAKGLNTGTVKGGIDVTGCSGECCQTIFR